jgi:tRNA(adenine34) deaminase
MRTRDVTTPPSPHERDIRMLRRCIELSRHATSLGENPFACVICEDGRIIAETTTRAARDADITRHAEVLAISEAQKGLATSNLTRCTLYSNVEPCAMCAFCIRETNISRVVYCIPSPVMGGRSKWNILGDSDISDVLPEVFHRPPYIVGGLLNAEAEQVWREWHPVDWAVLRYRNAIGKPSADTGARTGRRRIWQALRSWINPANPKDPPTRS